MSSSAALSMLTAFASVGARSFDVTLLDIEGREQGYQSNRSLEGTQAQHVETAGSGHAIATQRCHSPAIDNGDPDTA
jgi:hypothetical protein